MLKITETRIRQIISEEIKNLIDEADDKPKEVSVAKKATGVIQGLFDLKKSLDELDPEAYNVVSQQVNDLQKVIDMHLEPVIDLVTPPVKSSKFSGMQDLHEPPAEEDEEVDAENEEGDLY